MKLGSLCSGYGGLELAALELWPDATVAWHAEIDPHASTVLAAHWPDVPNLGDLSAADWAEVEPVDVLTAGYPCQPFSTAGRRKGEDDARHLWPGVLRAVRHLRPRLVLLENVAGHLSLGFDRVLGDLAEAGFDAEWVCVRASDVGACHRRGRLFVVAADADGCGQQWRPERDSEPPTRLNVRDRDDHVRHGVQVGWPFGPHQPAVDRWAHILGRPAPPPLNDQRLNARFVEWMMGLPDGWVTDLVARRHALRILGNGVVPQQAAEAYRRLVAA